MKEFLVVTLLIAGVVCEAPYPASGWRPNGPAFELPQKPQKQEYLPPVDPRRPSTPNNDDVDVSVQGLPSQEKQPLFQLSPINGQQYNGPSVNADIRNLDPSFKQIQYQQQLQNAQIFARQREFDAQVGSPSNGLPNRQSPRQFVPESTTSTQKPRPKSNAEPTTERISLNQGEQFDNPDDQKEKVSVEVTKQNVQEYPPELFLRSLSQLNLQPQFVPLQQFGQLRGQIVYQPIQSSEPQGFDGPAHLAALPSVLAQKQLLQQQAQSPFAQNPIVVQQEPALLQDPNQPIVNQYQPQVQAFPQIPAQPVVLQPQPNQFVQPGQFPQPQFQPNPQLQPEADAETIPTNQQSSYPQTQTVILTQPNQAQPNFIQPNQFVQPGQYAPSNQVQPQFIQPAQLQPQLINPYAQANQQNQFFQPEFAQPAQLQPNQFAQSNQVQPQFVQAAQLQPQFVQQLEPQYVQAQLQPQLQTNQDAESIQPQYYQNQPQVFQPAQYPQGQDALQSGLNDQQDNNLDEENDDEGNRATAVATAFGARTQPRVFSSYGVPVPAYQTTTEAAQEESATEDGPAVAQATAVATGRRKNAKLRNRRVRPVFTVDRSGHLVLAQDN